MKNQIKEFDELNKKIMQKDKYIAELESDIDGITLFIFYKLIIVNGRNFYSAVK